MIANGKAKNKTILAIGLISIAIFVLISVCYSKPTSRDMAHRYLKLSLSNRENKNFQDAEKNIYEAFSYFNSIRDNYWQAACYEYIAYLKNDLHQSDSAIIYLERAKFKYRRVLTDKNGTLRILEEIRLSSSKSEGKSNSNDFKSKFDEIQKLNSKYKEKIDSIESEKVELKSQIIQIANDSQALIKHLDSLQNEIIYYKGLAEIKNLSIDKLKLEIYKSLQDYKMLTSTFLIENDSLFKNVKKKDSIINEIIKQVKVAEK